MTFGGTRSRENALKFQARHHILEIGILIRLELSGIKALKAWSQDNGTHVQINICFCLLKVDGLLFTKLLACRTLWFLAYIDAFCEIYTRLSIDSVLQGHGLGIGDINGLAFVHAQVKSILDFPRTLLCTNAATDALVFVNIPGSLDNLNLEVSGLAADGVYFSEGDEVDVDVPADLDQLGGDDSHRALIGGERLIELGHNPADTGRPFH
jgi:hypothetical protein